MVPFFRIFVGLEWKNCYNFPTSSLQQGILKACVPFNWFLVAESKIFLDSQ